MLVFECELIKGDIMKLLMIMCYFVGPG